MLGGKAAVDFPSLRARAHLSARSARCGLRCYASVDYGPVGPVDYDTAHLWIMLAELAVDFPALRSRAHLSAPVGAVDFPALRARAHLQGLSTNVTSNYRSVFTKQFSHLHL